MLAYVQPHQTLGLSKDFSDINFQIVAAPRVRQRFRQPFCNVSALVLAISFAIQMAASKDWIGIDDVSGHQSGSWDQR